MVELRHFKWFRSHLNQCVSVCQECMDTNKNKTLLQELTFKAVHIPLEPNNFCQVSKNKIQTVTIRTTRFFSDKIKVNNVYNVQALTLKCIGRTSEVCLHYLVSFQLTFNIFNKSDHSF